MKWVPICGPAASKQHLENDSLVRRTNPFVQRGLITLDLANLLLWSTLKCDKRRTLHSASMLLRVLQVEAVVTKLYSEAICSKV
jgi:hypothetical protein